MDKLSEQAYNCIDTLATVRNYQKMIEEDRNKGSFLFDQAILGPTLTMQMRGIRVDKSKIRTVEEETLENASELQRQINEMVGKEAFKWGKGIKPPPQQLAKLLYGKLNAPIQTSKDGGPTVNKEAIAKLIDSPKSSDEVVRVCEIAQELGILEEDRKLLQKPLRETGRMHSSWNVAGTSSGRLNCRQDHYGFGLNQQAMSKRLHKIFIPDPGYVLVNIDQKQAESKIVAYLSNCQKYKDMHKAGNTHVAIGKLIFPELNFDKKAAESTYLPWDPSKNYYDLFKIIAHANNYLQTAHGMARRMHVKKDTAQKYQNIYFGQLPEISAWHTEIRQQLKIYHYLTTPLGRTRFFLGRTWDDSLVKEGVAYVPQSLNSQLNKIIMWRIWNYFDPNRAQILGEVHDSNLFQIREGDVETLEEILHLSRISIPIRGDIMITEVDAQWGYSWGKEDLKTWTGKF